ncbi:MAG: PRC-barrel domain-containing protein [Patescibacteria group bacterium]|nr:PRC-barrel domain-containing protein [Patescibacteria group bacterium]
MKATRIINLPVFTQSDQFLGHVLDLEIDILSGKIEQLYVGDQKLLDKILRAEKYLLIHASQIVSISKDKVIVEDSTLKLGETLKSEVAIPAIEA